MSMASRCCVLYIVIHVDDHGTEEYLKSYRMLIQRKWETEWDGCLIFIFFSCCSRWRVLLWCDYFISQTQRHWSIYSKFIRLHLMFIVLIFILIFSTSRSLFHSTYAHRYHVIWQDLININTRHFSMLCVA